MGETKAALRRYDSYTRGFVAGASGLELTDALRLAVSADEGEFRRGHAIGQEAREGALRCAWVRIIKGVVR
jgi:hypothetical protein